MDQSDRVRKIEKEVMARSIANYLGISVSHATALLEGMEQALPLMSRYDVDTPRLMEGVILMFNRLSEKEMVE